MNKTQTCLFILSILLMMASLITSETQTFQLKMPVSIALLVTAFIIGRGVLRHEMKRRQGRCKNHPVVVSVDRLWYSFCTIATTGLFIALIVKFIVTP
jgi:hypothetical protein